MQWLPSMLDLFLYILLTALPFHSTCRYTFLSRRKLLLNVCPDFTVPHGWGHMGEATCDEANSIHSYSIKYPLQKIVQTQSP